MDNCPVGMRTPVWRGVRGMMRGAVRVVSCVGIATAMVAVGQTEAHAATWGWVDSFDSSPEQRWNLEGAGVFRYSASGLCRSGDCADVFATDYVSPPLDWTSVGREVHITPAENYQVTCTARVWLWVFTGTVDFNFEIIDPGSWRYVALKSASLKYARSGLVYTQFEVGPFTPPTSDVYFRVSRLPGSLDTGGNFLVDDASITCTY